MVTVEIGLPELSCVRVRLRPGRREHRAVDVDRHHGRVTLSFGILDRVVELVGSGEAEVRRIHQGIVAGIKRRVAVVDRDRSVRRRAEAGQRNRTRGSEGIVDQHVQHGRAVLVDHEGVVQGHRRCPDAGHFQRSEAVANLIDRHGDRRLEEQRIVQRSVVGGVRRKVDHAHTLAVMSIDANRNSPVPSGS